MVAVKLRTLIVDQDGCLAGNKQYVDHTGEKFFKQYCSLDIRAIREFLSFGVRVIIWSADDWDGGRAWAVRNGAEFVEARDKLAKLKEMESAGTLDAQTTLVIGDDAWDVQAMQYARWSAAPHDSHQSVWDGVPQVIDLMYANGGEGVVAALLDYLMSEGLP